MSSITIRISHLIYAAWAALLVSLAGMGTSAQAQDPHWSQFGASPLNLNPANTGFFDGDYRFVANHRNQWKSITTPFIGFSGSFESSLNALSKNRSRVATGFVFNNDRAGDSKMGTNSLMGNVALMRAVGSDSTHFIGGGLQLGVTLRSIDYSALTFDEQYDGDVFNPAMGNTENFDNNNHAYMDIGLGFQYAYKSEQGLTIGLGSSIQHLNRPNDGFFSSKVRLYPRLQNHLSFVVPLTGKLQLQPSALWMTQGGNNELTFGTSAQYMLSELPGRTYAFAAGAWLRSGDAVIPYAGILYNSLRLGISYDVNTSDLDRASNGRGGYELSLSYIIKKVKSTGIKPPCPLY